MASRDEHSFRPFRMEMLNEIVAVELDWLLIVVVVAADDEEDGDDVD